MVAWLPRTPSIGLVCRLVMSWAAEPRAAAEDVSAVPEYSRGDRRPSCDTARLKPEIEQARGARGSMAESPV